ncbi:hypothetical protein HPB47_016711 [Ixodes persulcatus]|uniref:Uncharacterized protein n=1 Tax=Ixodes persulcatus TaxID=34615 RepID=A0AC60QQC3_IXOPE|nr:hypothetical protein HPB47_016711 [Ixodes persulcatus]
MADGTASRVRYNERLIAEVEQRPSLWDSRSPKNRNVVTKNADWRRVAAALNSSGKEVQRRWKNLRDTFLRRLRDSELSPTSKDKAACVRWAYFHQMMFLKDVLDIRPTAFSGYVQKRPRASRADAVPRPALEDSWDVAITTDTEEPICETIIEVSNEPPAAPYDAPLPTDRVDLDECMTCEVQVARRPSPSPSPAASSMAEEMPPKRRRLDDWDHFLMSLKRHLRCTPDHLVGSAQMHLLQMAVTYGAGRTPQALMPLDL